MYMYTNTFTIIYITKVSSWYHMLSIVHHIDTYLRNENKHQPHVQLTTFPI